MMMRAVVVVLMTIAIRTATVIIGGCGGRCSATLRMPFGAVLQRLADVKAKGKLVRVAAANVNEPSLWETVGQRAVDVVR